jgi:hypothetical protein
MSLRRLVRSPAACTSSRAPTSGTTARDVGESSTPLIRRTVSGAASCATPRPKLIQPSPRPRRCTSSCLAFTASRVASRVTGSLRIRSIAPGRASRSTAAQGTARQAGIPGKPTRTRQSTAAWRSHRLPGPRVTASGRAPIVTATGRRTPGPAPTTRTDVSTERRMSPGRCGRRRAPRNHRRLPARRGGPRRRCSARRHGRGPPAPAQRPASDRVVHHEPAMHPYQVCQPPEAGPPPFRVPRLGSPGASRRLSRVSARSASKTLANESGTGSHVRGGG